MTDSHLTYHANGEAASFVGRDAIEFYKAAQLGHFIKLWAKCGMIPTRGYTITKMLAAATQFTGKTYKRSQAAQAAEDVLIWAREMKAALPVVERV